MYVYMLIEKIEENVNILIVVISNEVSFLFYACIFYSKIFTTMYYIFNKNKSSLGLGKLLGGGTLEVRAETSAPH